MNTKISGLIMKADYDKKIVETEKKITNQDHGKYITTPEFNKLIPEKFKEKSKQADFCEGNWF